MKVFPAVFVICVVCISAQYASALECHECKKESSEAACNQQPTVTCAMGETCKMTVRRREAGDLYTKGCYAKSCNDPGVIFCVNSEKVTCKICCNSDLCNSDASAIVAYLDQL